MQRDFLLTDLNKSKLTRSTSVPASYPGSAEVNPALHRMLYRTGSFVSDLTKQKLKNSILARTSAALVRKPSITGWNELLFIVCVIMKETFLIPVLVRICYFS